MIRNFEMMNYINEPAYRKICEKYGFDFSESNIPANRKYFNDNSPFIQFSVFNIVYRDLGHIWFFPVILNAPRLFSACEITQDNFRTLLLKAYKNEFGTEIMDVFPNFDYERRPGAKAVTFAAVEYVSYVNTENADSLIERLSGCNFSHEQLNPDYFNTYKLKSNAYITFTINKISNTKVRLCAKVASTALKKTLGQKNLGGTDIDKVLNKENAFKILNKQVIKHTKPITIDELSEQAIWEGIDSATMCPINIII